MVTDLTSVRVIVYGSVQGVFFRAFTHSQATKLGLTGYVRNLPGGEAVEVKAEGEREQLKRLISYLKVGPPTAKVEKVATSWSSYTGRYSGFNISY